MSINVKCPGCEGQYVLKDTQAGMQVKCPRCGATISVPQPQVTSAQPAPPAPQPPVTSAQPTPPDPQPPVTSAQPTPPAPQPPVTPPAAAAPAHTPAPMGQVVLPATAKILSNLKLAGIFNIVVGILSLLWAILMLVEVFFAPTLAKADPEVPMVFMILIFLVMFALSAGCGIVELLAGIKLLKRRPGARKLGLISGFASCASLWGCCVYPFCLAAGIFTLVLLFKEQYRVFLERGEAVG